MDKQAVKAIVMAILSPQGNVMNLNDQNFNFMERNADEIMERCFGIPGEVILVDDITKATPKPTRKK